ncbi:MAG TPA: TfoX/Sxy family protein [Anaerolineae bacterium]|jgi:TfoX/Sxy family transcriptional regulator of competence genes|nr:TfoX/Sxy family protein [Anaerolineae bacterium]
MAEPYLERLAQMIGRLELSGAHETTLEPRHFFSGAALYANGKICVLFSPRGFALKLPAATRQALIEAGKGGEFRFFADGPVKRDYVALAESVERDDEAFRELIGASVDYVAGSAASDAAAGRAGR